jgi:hypothetical protein
MIGIFMSRPKRKAPVYCAVCGSELRPPRTKYCRDECYEEGSRQIQKDYAQEVKKGERVRQRQGPRRFTIPDEKRALGKRRCCLRCGKEFLSLGSGNRICGGCNQANTDWLAGKGEQFIFTAALWDGPFSTGEG